MSDQSRLFVAAVLMMGVLLISWFITGRNTQAPAGETVAEPVESVEPDLGGEAEAITAPEDQQSEDSNLEYTYEAREVTVLIPGENGSPMVTAVLSTTGGSVVRWRLEEYEDYPDQDTGQRVELSEEPWLVTSDAQGDPILFTYQGPDTVVAGESPVTVLFNAPGGAEKVFEFTEGYYGFTVRKTGLDENTSVTAGAIPVTETEAQDRGYFKASWYTNGHKSEDSEKIEALQPSGNVSWVATSSKYFTIILMPLSMERAD
ncbi:MAG TPA: YidC/Oxa1 family insertase periplasmic-domain containing protein, partial [Candidatus Sabulitectum sp.]|nr:YidC/Oxa1 family insertase periplasmic-domain containing protein [Candidatus Sabulitectum sp.]